MNSVEFFDGPPLEKLAPMGGSDPRSGGVLGRYFDGPPLEKLAPWGAATCEAVERGGHKLCN